jgi:hypothetical protein
VNNSDSSEIARLNEEGALRRKKIARNRRQREAYGPKHRRRAGSLLNALNVAS